MILCKYYLIAKQVAEINRKKMSITLSNFKTREREREGEREREREGEGERERCISFYDHKLFLSQGSSNSLWDVRALSKTENSLRNILRDVGSNL